MGVYPQAIDTKWLILMSKCGVLTEEIWVKQTYAVYGRRRIVYSTYGFHSACHNGQYLFKLKTKGTRIVQADAASDSENRRQWAQSVVQADSGSVYDTEIWRQSAHRMSFVGGAIQTVGVRRLTGMISSFLFRLSE